MKKFFYTLCLLVCCAFVLVGCDVQGGNDVVSIHFVRPIFYVDLGVPTRLEYEVNPVTAKNYFVGYDIDAGIAVGTSPYDVKDGVITVTSREYKPIRIIVKLGNLSDTCEVRLREYPTQIGFGEESLSSTSTDTIYGGTIYQINLKGNFSEGIRGVYNDEFIYKLESSDPSVVEIVDAERLLVKSTGRQGSARIDVVVCNSLGEEQTNLKASINLNVESAVKTYFATLGQTKLSDGKTISLELNSEDELPLQMLCFSEDNILIDGAEFSFVLSNNDVFEVLDGEKKNVLKVKEFSGEKEVIITLISNGVDTAGKPIKIVCKLQVRSLA